MEGHLLRDACGGGQNYPSGRSKVIEVPKTSRHEIAEVAKNVPQDRISERSQVIEVPKTSRHEIRHRSICTGYHVACVLKPRKILLRDACRQIDTALQRGEC